MKKFGIAAMIVSVVSLCLSAVCMAVTLNRSAQPQKDDTLTTQYVMYVGTNDKDTYQPKYTEEEAKKIVDEICLKYFEGYTLQDATGSWTDEQKNITHEYTLVCYFDGADKDTVYQAADDVIRALNQNTVLIEQDAIKTEYYSGK